jgi:prepilin-type N-terminal cleavage/methylation domain-containing protein
MKLKIVQKKYSGFTLTEMLIVMAIFMILFAMGVTGFAGLRDTVLVNENSQSLQQDIRWAQRAAILLKRESDDKWLYGIGIDFRNTPVDGTYKIFKWCSPYDEYGIGRSRNILPNYDPSANGGRLQSGNGSIAGFGGSGDLGGSTLSNCTQTGSVSNNPGRLIEIKNRLSANQVESVKSAISKPLLVGIGYGGAYADRPAVVLFESVSGKPYFYKSNGTLFNYNTNATPVNNPQDLVFGIATPEKENGALIVIHAGSGKVTAKSITPDKMNTLIFK